VSVVDLHCELFLRLEGMAQLKATASGLLRTRYPLMMVVVEASEEKVIVAKRVAATLRSPAEMLVP